MENNYIIHDIAFKIGSMAVQSILYEVSCFPSPGLVSCVSNGAHKDMNFYTFMDSTAALMKYLILCAQTGLEAESASTILETLKCLGIAAEQDMFTITNGVNTHKGMLFLMGICCGAAGYAVKQRSSFHELEHIIRSMTQGLVSRELNPLLQCKDQIEAEHVFGRKLSYGERLFLEHRIEGVRGAVEQGLPIVFHVALDVYQKAKDLDKNDRLIHTLIAIMQCSEDTNIIHRHSVEVLREVKAKAGKIMELGGMRTEEGRSAIQRLDTEFRVRNISPGGSADVLAVTVFMDLLELQMYAWRALTGEVCHHGRTRS